jgi:hypothetical protein
MQLTQEQVDDWADDANAMLSEENLGSTGVRASAEALLQSLVTCGGGSGPSALADAVQQRLAEADSLQVYWPAVTLQLNKIFFNSHMMPTRASAKPRLS